MRKLLPLLAILAFVGCSDPYGACEKAALDIATGITAGMTTIDSLRTTGVLSAQEEVNVLGYLKFANDADGAFGACAQAAHTAGGKAGAYTACAQAFQAALANPSELALIHVSNPTTQTTVSAIVAAITTGASALITALGGK